MQPLRAATRLRLVLGLCDANQAFAPACEWPESGRAVASHRVPSFFDAAIVGFLFGDVTRDQRSHFDSIFRGPALGGVNATVVRVPRPSSPGANCNTPPFCLTRD